MAEIEELRGTLSGSESPYEECPFCGTKELAGDRMAVHVWGNHEQVIREAANE